MDSTLEALYQVVLDRRAHPQEGSYTCYLFDKGLDKILKKVGEECAETIIAAKTMCLPIRWGRSLTSSIIDGDAGGKGYPLGAMCWLSWTAGAQKNRKPEADETSG